MTIGRPKRKDGRNANTVANKKYNTANYERLNIYFKKGEREKVKKYAAEHGESANSLINRLLADEIPDFEPINGNGSNGAP